MSRPVRIGVYGRMSLTSNTTSPLGRLSERTPPREIEQSRLDAIRKAHTSLQCPGGFEMKNASELKIFRKRTEGSEPTSPSPLHNNSKERPRTCLLKKRCDSLVRMDVATPKYVLFGTCPWFTEVNGSDVRRVVSSNKSLFVISDDRVNCLSMTESKSKEIGGISKSSKTVIEAFNSFYSIVGGKLTRGNDSFYNIVEMSAPIQIEGNDNKLIVLDKYGECISLNDKGGANKWSSKLRILKVACNSKCNVFLFEDGNVGTVGDDSMKTSFNKDVISIECTEDNIFALTFDGDLISRDGTKHNLTKVLRIKKGYDGLLVEDEGMNLYSLKSSNNYTWEKLGKSNGKALIVGNGFVMLGEERNEIELLPIITQTRNTLCKLEVYKNYYKELIDTEVEKLKKAYKEVESSNKDDLAKAKQELKKAKESNKGNIKAKESKVKALEEKIKEKKNQYSIFNKLKECGDCLDTFYKMFRQLLLFLSLAYENGLDKDSDERFIYSLINTNIQVILKYANAFASVHDNIDDYYPVESVLSKIEETILHATTPNEDVNSKNPTSPRSPRSDPNRHIIRLFNNHFNTITLLFTPLNYLSFLRMFYSNKISPIKKSKVVREVNLLVTSLNDILMICDEKIKIGNYYLWNSMWCNKNDRTLLVQEGKLNDFISMIKSDNKLDKHFKEVFVTTITSYLNIDMVFEALLPVHRGEVSKKEKKNILQLLKLWLELNPKDFVKVSGTKSKLEKFIEMDKDDSNAELKKAIQQLYKEASEMKLDEDVALFTESNEIDFQSVYTKIPAEQFADMLNYVDMKLFNKCKVSDFASELKLMSKQQTPLKRLRESQAWLTNAILKTAENTKDYMKITGYLIYVGKRLIELYDYTGMAMIIDALNKSKELNDSINRLASIELGIYNNMVSFTRDDVIDKSTGNIKKDVDVKNIVYVMEKINISCVPVFGVVGKRLNEIDTSGLSLIPQTKRYNFSKLRSVYDFATRCMSHQNKEIVEPQGVNKEFMNTLKKIYGVD